MLLQDTKVCSKCKSEQPLTNFFKDNSRPDGRQNYCKPCKAAYNKSWRPEGYDRLATKDRDLRRAYGINLEGFNAMSFAVDYKCEICGGRDGRELCVDHNHETGEVRGLLCSTCNTGLGHFKDSVEKLGNAIQYLKEKGSYGH